MRVGVLGMRRGFAKRLYRDLIERAMLAGQSFVTCEIDSDPPNPASDAFHTALGFSQVGTATIHAGLKTVRYFALDLLAPTLKKNRVID